MKTWMIGLVGASMLLAALPATAASLGDRATYFVGEDQNGNLVVERITADETFSCGGTAPLTTACSTGTHPYSGGFMIHGFLLSVCTTVPGAGNCYVGTQQSVVKDATHTRNFRCDVNAVGPFVIPFLGIRCSGQGSFPTSTYSQNCRSLMPLDIETNLNMEGGAGDWMCWTAHS